MNIKRNNKNLTLDTSMPPDLGPDSPNKRQRAVKVVPHAEKSSQPAWSPVKRAAQYVVASFTSPISADRASQAGLLSPQVVTKWQPPPPQPLRIDLSLITSPTGEPLRDPIPRHRDEPVLFFWPTTPQAAE